MRIDVVWYDPLMVAVFIPCLSMHVVIMDLKEINVNLIVYYDAYAYEVVIWRLCKEILNASMMF